MERTQHNTENQRTTSSLDGRKLRTPGDEIISVPCMDENCGVTYEHKLEVSEVPKRKTYGPKKDKENKHVLTEGIQRGFISPEVI